MAKISLDFPSVQGQKFYVFPLPLSNAYQRVEILHWPRDYQIVQDQAGNQLLLFPTALPNSLVFKQVPLAVKKNLKNVEFIRLKPAQILANSYINHQDEKIQALAEKFRVGVTADWQIVERLYESTLQYLSYGQAIRDLHPYSQALEEKVTDCGGFATFLASLLGSQGFQTRLVVGYLWKSTWRQRLKNYLKINQTWSDLSMHAWLEVALTDGSYLPLDAAVDWRYRQGQSARQARLGNLPADRLVLSAGCDQHLHWQSEAHQRAIWQHPEIISSEKS